MHSTTSSDDELDDVIAYSPYATDNELDDVIAYSPYATDNDSNVSGELISPEVPEQPGNEPQQCKICHAIVPTMRELIIHFLLHHEAAGEGSLREISKRESKALPDVQQKYVCGMCGVECFDTMRETRRHMIEEHGYQDEKARDSGADYSSDDHSDGSTDTNVSVEGSENDSIDGVSSGMVSEMSYQHACATTVRVCRARIQSPSNARPRSMREVRCRICSQRFANNAQRSVHEAQHRKKGHQMTLDVVQEEVEEEMPCESREAPQLAPKKREPKPKRPVKPRTSSSRLCKLCKRMFANAKTLSKHVQTVHFKIKPFICNVCGYKCARKVTLNIHMRQHSGVKPLACQSCSFQTADPSALHYHKRRHQQEKSYKCRTCGFNTVQPTVLKEHIQRRHPQEYERLKCRLCSYASINAQNLRRHVAEHEAGLIGDGDRENDRHEMESHAAPRSVSRAEVKNVPEISLDCFLPPESVDSVVHDAGGITIPAVDGPVSVAHSEDTQFPL
ncbi:AGAP006446-PA-like protein [Anopheles sinensis]|uniref:AGAP006446-PA-like protein n=1 Tax=Anopheles sinensis TaxID=74873 RepID=A0A084VY56_ANOSI|nr:AGAP006446-PA-like protein [Anopheles sinensis]